MIVIMYRKIMLSFICMHVYFRKYTHKENPHFLCIETPLLKPNQYKMNEMVDVMSQKWFPNYRVKCIPCA